jgi:hypothetical protein
LPDECQGTQAAHQVLPEGELMHVTAARLARSCRTSRAEKIVPGEGAGSLDRSGAEK